MKNKIISLLVIVFAVTISIECKKNEPISLKTEKKVDVAFGVVTFITGAVSINDRIAASGDRVVKGDVVTVKDNSMAVIQFLQDIIITVKENTKIEFESMEKTINGISPIVIKQPLGRMFSKIMKKGSDFQVRTPTTIAGVRGTEFETIVGEKSTTIKLLTGKVTAAPIVDEIAVEEKSVEITENTKIEISHDDVKTPEPITVEEKQNLEAYAKIEPVINIESDETLQNLQSPEPEKNPIVIPEEIKEEVLPPKLTIEKIKKTYGNISKIFLKDGTEYVGAFTQSGAEMVIITTDGTISIKSKDVAKISSFK